MQTDVRDLYSRKFYYLSKGITAHSAKYCKMAIWVGESAMRVVILEPTSQKAYLFAEYSLFTNEIEEKVLVLDSIMNSYPLFRFFRGKNLILCVDNQKFTILPRPAFDPNHCADYLNFVCDTRGFAASFYINEPTEVTAVFGVEPEIVSWLEKINGELESTIVHQANSLIVGIGEFLEEKKLNNEPRVVAFLNSTEVHVVVMNKNRLVLYNRFPVNNLNEATYCILRCMKALNLQPSIHQLLILGKATKESAIYKKIKEYVKDVAMPYKRLWLPLDSIKLHNLWITNFDLYSCVLL